GCPSRIRTSITGSRAPAQGLPGGQFDRERRPARSPRRSRSECRADFLACADQARRNPWIGLPPSALSTAASGSRAILPLSGEASHFIPTEVGDESAASQPKVPPTRLLVHGLPYTPERRGMPGIARLNAGVVRIGRQLEAWCPPANTCNLRLATCGCVSWS